MVASIRNPVYSRTSVLDRGRAALKRGSPGTFQAAVSLLSPLQILSGVILEVLGEAFTEVITAEVASAWAKLLDNMCCAIAAVYREAGWGELSSPGE